MRSRASTALVHVDEKSPAGAECRPSGLGASSRHATRLPGLHEVAKFASRRESELYVGVA